MASQPQDVLIFQGSSLPNPRQSGHVLSVLCEQSEPGAVMLRMVLRTMKTSELLEHRDGRLVCKPSLK